jgi:hypothetical protein
MNFATPKSATITDYLICYYNRSSNLCYNPCYSVAWLTNRSANQNSGAVNLRGVVGGMRKESRYVCQFWLTGTYTEYCNISFVFF